MTMEAYDGSRHREAPVLAYDGSDWQDVPVYLHDGSYWVRQKTRPQVGVSRWTFDSTDTDSGTAVDTWNTNDGTINGATTGQSGANVTYDTGEAYDFDGTDDYVTVPDDAALDQNTFTISAWAYYDGSGFSYANILNRYSVNGWAGSTFGYALRVFDGSYWEAGFTDGNNDYRVGGSSTSSITTDQWYHLTATYDGDELVLYIDGSRVDTNSVSTTVIQRDKPMTIGASEPDKGRFGGKIDDVRIYDKALTDAEARRLYHLGNINYPPASAISRWPFDDSATDSGTAVDVWDTNDATIYNGGSWTTDSVTSGYAYSFDGTDSYAKASNPGPTSDAARSVTVSFKTTDSGYLVGYGDTGVGTSFRVGVSTYGDQEGITIDIGSGAVNYVANVQDGNWHTVTAVVRAVSNPELRDVKVYLDGNELTNRGTYTNLDRGISTSSTNGLTFGGLPWLTSSKYLNGKLDEARVHSTELTETEADRLYNVGAI